MIKDERRLKHFLVLERKLLPLIILGGGLGILGRGLAEIFYKGICKDAMGGVAIGIFLIIWAILVKVFWSNKIVRLILGVLAIYVGLFAIFIF